MGRHFAVRCLSLLAFWASFTLGATAEEPDDSGWSPARIVEGVVRHGEVGFRALYTVNRDGTGAEFLTAAPAMISNSAPAFSSDGQYVAFDARPDDAGPEPTRIFIAAVAGPFKGKVLELGPGHRPEWTPDGHQIVYEVHAGNSAGGKPGTWMMNADGTNRRWMANGYFARIAPNGERMCVHSLSETGFQIIEIPSRESRPLLRNDWAPVDGGEWSPDSSRIAFVGQQGGKEHLATIAADGDVASIQIVCTDMMAGEQLVGAPAWSPDGKLILFAKEPTNVRGARRYWGSQIYSVPADGSAEPVLLEGKKIGQVNRAPRWSPDGSKIVFSSER